MICLTVTETFLHAAVFQITFEGGVLPTKVIIFEGADRYGSLESFSSLPFVLLGQVASCVRFFT